MNITQLFDLCAASYDRDRSKLVPCFDEFYGTVIRLIPFEPSATFRCLDLGAGTGLLAALVKQAFPNAAMHLTDASEAMLALVPRLARLLGRPKIKFSWAAKILQKDRRIDLLEYAAYCVALGIDPHAGPDRLLGWLETGAKTVYPKHVRRPAAYAAELTQTEPTVADKPRKKQS